MPCKQRKEHNEESRDGEAESMARVALRVSYISPAYEGQSPITDSHRKHLGHEEEMIVLLLILHAIFMDCTYFTRLLTY